MQSLKNPFTPSFGKVPLHMAGRREILDDMIIALNNGSGDPNLATLLIGARGTGKTALLTRISNESEKHGWVAVDVSARPGMLQSILNQTRKATAHLIDNESSTKLKGVQLGQLVGLEWDVEKKPSDWRIEMEQVLDQLEEHHSGLLITVDEVRSDLEEMVDLVSIFQHFVRENRTVALIMAGLPHKVSELLSSEDISFVRRARHRHFGRIPNLEIEDALVQTVHDGGRFISPDAIQAAVKAIDGFPYMMQLVGYKAWEQSADPEISLKDVENAVKLAQKELAESIFDATFRELSKKDIEFLEAMLEDEKESLISDIAVRMKVRNNYAGQYKLRLLEQGVIGERGRGVVAFELPGFREYLEDRLHG